MSPHRIGISRPDSASGYVDDAAGRRAKAGRDAAIVAAMIAAIVILHLFTENSSSVAPLHLLYRRMYYVPIIYAAWVFGKTGGVVAAVASIAVFFGFHSEIFTQPSAGIAFDGWVEAASFVLAGVLFGSVRDVEEAKTGEIKRISIQLEEAYRKLEERAIQLINVQEYTSSILRSITAGVITVGPDGSVATANPAAERMLGMSEFEMVPKAIGSVFSDDAGLAADVEKVLSGRVPLALRDTTFTTYSGRRVHVQASASRMRAVAGTVLGAVVTLEDVSDIRALTDQLIRADRLAAMGELTAGVAHEVRNPLGVIRASVQLLEDAQCDPDRIRDAAAVIKQEIDRLDRVIKALLDFGRPSKPTLMAIDLVDVLQDVTLFTTRFAKQSDVSIVLEAAPDMPRVEGDPDQLKQVFLNLVTNAVQAMTDGGGAIRILARGDGDYVVVEVHDDGPGIAQADLPKVFDPFFTKRSEGTGLGLTIVHRIIDEHDGHIEVRSSKGGTVFTVTLPAQIEE